MEFDKKKFIKFFIENNGVTFFDKSALAKYSNKPSTVYFNWRLISEDVYLVDKCADYIINFVQDKKINPDCFLGIPEGATKLAIILQYKWVKKYKKNKSSLPFVRGSVKKHGALKDRIFLGIPKGKVVLIEDVVSRGGAILDTLKKLEKIRIVPYAIICLSDRTNEESRKKLMKILNKKKIKFYSLTIQNEVIEEAVRILNPSKKIIEKLKKHGKIV